jgi:hypothetical protein
MSYPRNASSAPAIPEEDRCLYRCIFYGALVFGSLTSALGAAWKFAVEDSKPPVGRPVDLLNEMGARIRRARSE